jgi:tetratricopeptide (TPR) repeat protein
VERTTNRDSRFAWVLGCCWLSLLLILALVSPIQGAEEHKEYDFELAKGLYLYNQGRYREAERYFKEALSVKPGDQTSGYYLGLTSLRLQRYREAGEQFREVLRRHPDRARAHMGLGMALYHQGRYREASTELTIADGR